VLKPWNHNKAGSGAVSRLPKNARGNTMMEMLIAVALLSLVAGVVFSQIFDVIKKSSGEQGKLDISQQTREFMDEIIRDMHQSGYPSLTMYDPANGIACSAGTYCTATNVAMGVTSFSPTDLKLEGDVNGNGIVDIIEYSLYDNGGNPVCATYNGTTNCETSVTCPCSLRRTEQQKAGAIGNPTFYVEVGNVINGSTGTGSTVTVAGNTTQGASNTTVYSAYTGTTTQIFQAFDYGGNPITGTYPLTSASNMSTLAKIDTVKVTLNVISQNYDPSTGANAVISRAAAGRVHNNW
jgi:type II secretory pathway pseudopilin PulG